MQGDLLLNDAPGNGDINRGVCTYKSLLWLRCLVDHMVLLGE